MDILNNQQERNTTNHFPHISTSIQMIFSEIPQYSTQNSNMVGRVIMK